MKKYRTPESVKKRIDAMQRKGIVILDHGIGSYKFSHYIYDPPSVNNGYESSLHIFYEDFDVDRTVKHYMTLTNENLQKPRADMFCELVDCYWEREFPTLLVMREYDSWR